MSVFSITLRALLSAVVALSPLAARAADPYPTKPVRIVVGFPPSGISDNLARVMAKVLSEQTGQQFYIDNRPGAGTTIAAAMVAAAPPDGYTLFMQDLTSHAISASLYKTLPYDPVKDFTPITLVASTPIVMVLNPKLGMKSVQDLVAKAKAKPGELNYGSSGIGSILHLAGETFKQRAGVDIVHVPYKGATGAAAAMIGGQVAMTFTTMPTAVPMIAGNQATPVAVTTKSRAVVLPNVPTMQEAGIADYEIVLFNGILAPRGLPPDIAAKLRTEILKALESPEVKAFYKNVSADVVTSTSQELAVQMTNDIAKYAKAVQAANIKPE